MSLGPFNAYKVLRNAGRMSMIANGAIIPPITASVEPSSFCNLKCPYCNSKKFRAENQSKLPKDLLQRLPQELSIYGVKGVLFTGGGEPLSNPHLLPTFEDYKRRGLDVGLITNGTMFRSMDDFYDVVGSCSFVRISLDAIQNQTYQRMHGTKIDVAVVLRYIKELVKARSHSCNSKCKIGVSYLIDKDNLNEFDHAVKTLRELGINYVQVKPIFIPKSKFGKLREERDIVRSVVNKVKAKYEEGGFKVYFLDHYFEEGKADYVRPYSVCLGHYLTANILSNGKLSICCQNIEKKEQWFGDLSKQSFKEAWESEEHTEAANNIKLAECKPCKFEESNKMLWAMKLPHEHENFI